MSWFLNRGAALIDVVVCAGLLAVLAGIALPVVHRTRERDMAWTAARLLAGRLQQARLEALKRNVSVAMRFDAQDVSRFALFVDGDGDGVLESDIAQGVDRELTPESRLTDFVQGIELRIVRDVPAPDGSGTLAAGSDPLRIGPSHLMTFSPLGTSTSGTLYVAGASGPQMAIRVFGATARIRVLRFEPASAAWRVD